VRKRRKMVSFWSYLCPFLLFRQHGTTGVGQFIISTASSTKDRKLRNVLALKAFGHSAALNTIITPARAISAFVAFAPVM